MLEEEVEVVAAMEGALAAAPTLGAGLKTAGVAEEEEEEEATGPDVDAIEGAARARLTGMGGRGPVVVAMVGTTDPDLLSDDDDPEGAAVDAMVGAALPPSCRALPTPPFVLDFVGSLTMMGGGAAS